MNLKVFIVPNASKNEIVSWYNDYLKIKIATPPKGGKANKELIVFLAKSWDIPKSSIKIIHGLKNRKKVLKIITDKPLPLPQKEQIELM